MSVVPATSPHPQEAPAGLYRLTVDVYHKMISQGLLPEGAPYELIDGAVVRKDRSAAGEDPKTVGTGHATSVSKLSQQSSKLRRLNCHMRVQQPVTFPPQNEPEPDGSIVTGKIEDYRDRHPGAKDVICVIEVADSSLQYDRTRKQQVYADNGIPQYVIVNLLDQCVEVYSDPLPGKGRYGRSETLTGRQSLVITPHAGKGLSVPIRQLLP
jgi:Uma2 family endonuclease